MGLLPPIIAELRMEAGQFRSELNKVHSELQKLGSEGASHFDRLKAAAGPALMGAGAAATAAGFALEHLAHQAEESRVRLEQSIKNSGHDFEEYKSRILSADSQMEHFGHTHSDTEAALGTLTTALQDPNKALQDMAMVSDLAAYKHISLADAATMVAKAHGGAGRMFKEFGIQVVANADGTKDYDGALKTLGERLQGQASAQADTFGGHLAALRVHVTDIAAGIGEKVAPALIVAGPLMTGLGATTQLLSGKFGALKSAMTSAEGGLSGLGKAATVTGGVLAVAALTVGVWEKAHADAKKRTMEFVDALTADNGALGTNTDALIRNKVAHSGLSDSLTKAGLNYDQFVAGLKDSQGPGGAVIKQLFDRGKLTGEEAIQLGNLVNAYQSGTKAMESNVTAGVAVTDTTDKVTKMTKEEADALKATEKAEADLTKAVDAGRSAQEKLNSEVSDYDTYLKNITNTQDTLRGKDMAWNEALLNLQDTVKKNGPVWDIWTQKGIDNNKALDNTTTAIAGVIGQLGEKWKDNVDKFSIESKRFVDEAINNAKALGAPNDVLDDMLSKLTALEAMKEINIRVKATVYNRQQINDIGSADPVLAAQILGYPTGASGMVVPGPRGAPRLMIGHGGETIGGAQAMADSGGGSVINNYFEVPPNPDMGAFARTVQDALRAAGLYGLAVT